MASAGTAARRSFFWPRKVALTNIPTLISILGFAISTLTFAVRMFGSRIGPILLIFPLSVLSGYAFRRISAVSPRRTLARSFSYTSQTIHTHDKSEIVKGFAGADNPCTPDALVTCWSVITPETGA